MATISEYQPPIPQMQPIILSMEVDDDDSSESEYRVRIGNRVKYIIISPKTFDRETLSFPIQSLPSLPYDEEWTVARISRDVTNGDLKISISDQTLAGVKCQWHNTRIDCLELERTKQLTAMAFEADPHSNTATSPLPIANVIAQRVYELLEKFGLAPRFLGHVHENAHVMGFLLEKVEGRPASFKDLNMCETALGKLHSLGFVHSDVNRYNLLITNEGVKLLDFEHLVENASPESMLKELENLCAELVDDSGRGGGFIFHGDSD